MIPAKQEGAFFDLVEDDIVFGRLGVGGDGDESDFDALMPREVDLTAEDVASADLFAGGDNDKPAPFEEPEDDVFPVFQRALRRFQAEAREPKAVRVDDEHSYGEFVCDKAVRELDRRLRELRAVVEEHLAAHQTEEHPGYRGKLRTLSRWSDEVLGAAEAVKQLRGATKAEDVVEALPAVPVALPPYAEGKVRCWREGDKVVCSLKFQAADGGLRVATMASEPRVDEQEIVEWASERGADPVTVLGLATDLADSATAQRLVRETAGAALEAQRRLDVCAMDGEPVVLVRGSDDSSPALAALMHLEQRCRVGDKQACAEMAAIEAAGRGRRQTTTLLGEARRRLTGAVKPAPKANLASRYAMLALCV